MYYSKQNSINSDYYNSYKDELYQYGNGKNYLMLILKILVIILLLGLLFVGYLFISNKNSLINIQGVTPSENFVAVKSDLNQEDIESIVHIVMEKMNQEKSVEVNDNIYKKELLKQEIDRLDEKREDTTLPKVDIGELVKNRLSLEGENHYNKVVINRPNEEKYTNDRLTELSSEISGAINYDSSDMFRSDYTQEIMKEIATRSNEMRIIIVKRGDTLSKIAFRAYNDYNAYIKIFKANPEVIKNPNQIFVGQKLRIPL